MKAIKMMQAESMRYAKIERLIDLLCRNKKKLLLENVVCNFDMPLKIGKRVIVEKEKLIIGNKIYNSCDLKKVTINTEGSISIYNRSGRKVCGWTSLNLSVKNIEMFCVWVRKNDIPAETVSGNTEKGFQWFILGFVILIIILINTLRIL